MKTQIDRIPYTDPFKEVVRGRLLARFRLDADGTPQFALRDEDDGLRVYTIDLFLASPRAGEIRWVNYQLDDDSYIDPQGWSDDADNEFPLEISSYGDVEVVVTVHMRDKKKIEQRAWLSHMLANGHADKLTPAIKAALRRIEVY